MEGDWKKWDTKLNLGYDIVVYKVEGIRCIPLKGAIAVMQGCRAPGLRFKVFELRGSCWGPSIKIIVWGLHYAGNPDSEHDLDSLPPGSGVKGLAPLNPKP